MAVQWYCRIDGKELGPMSGDELKRLAREGRLDDHCYVRKGHDSSWTPARVVKGLFDQAPAAPAPLTPAAAPPAVPPATAPPPGGGTRRLAPRSIGPRTPKPPPTPPSGPAAPAPGVVAAPQPVAVTAVAPSPVAVSTVASDSGEHASLATTKKSSPVPLIVGGLITVVVLLGAGLGLGALYLSSKADDFEEQLQAQIEDDFAAAEADRADAEETADDAAAEDAPTQETTDNQATAVATRSRAAVSAQADNKTAQSNATLDQDDPRTEYVEKVRTWKRALKSGRTMAVRSSRISFGVNAAWLGSDTTFDLKDPANGALLNSDQPAKYLYVEVQITNRLTDQPMAYSGWNGLQRSDHRGKAILLDDQGRYGNLVSQQEAPDEARLMPQQIAPDAQVVDILAFELPSTDFQSLRLAVPIPGAGGRYYGFELTKSMIVGSGVGEDEEVAEEGDQPIAIPGLRTPQPKPPTDDPVEGQPTRGGTPSKQPEPTEKPEQPPEEPGEPEQAEEPAEPQGGPIPIPGLEG